MKNKDVNMERLEALKNYYETHNEDIRDLNPGTVWLNFSLPSIIFKNI